MFSVVFILMYVIIITPSASQSTAGMLFVLAIPELIMHKIHYAAILHITSELEYGTLWVAHPVSYDTGEVSKKSYVIRGSEHLLVHLPQKIALPKTGIYPTTVIKSSGRIRILVHVASSGHISSDVYLLIPENVCHESYYVTTTKGNPFIMVKTFRSPTNIKVSFPKMGSKFKIPCNGDVHCTSGSEVRISLKSYQVWYLKSANLLLSFHNTKITSDFPVFVVSGNTECSNRFINEKKYYTLKSVDMCASSMKPVSAWGKTYAVPRNIVPNTGIFYFFQVNFVNETLNLRYWIKKDGGELTHEDEVVRSDKPSTIQINGDKRSLLITAEEPFGLYQFFEATTVANYKTDSSMLSLIPVEQWIHGIFWVDVTLKSDFLNRYFILGVGDVKKIFVLDDNRTIEWEETFEIEGRKYFHSTLDLKGLNSRIYANGTARFIVYIQTYPKYMRREGTMMNLPYEFHQSKIFNVFESCKVGETVADDGIDNDCDGQVDEESLNDKDDDGDGDIDEDLVGIYRDGEWSEWSSMCGLICNNLSYEVDTRSCLEKSKFGSYCVGESIRCNNSNCPDTCFEYENPVNGTNCYCGKAGGCDECEKGLFICDSCKPGFAPSETCTSKCPVNFGGKGCMEISVKDRDPDQGKEQTSETVIDHSYIFLALILAVAIISGLIFYHKSTHKVGKSKSHISYPTPLENPTAREESQMNQDEESKCNTPISEND